MKLIRASEFGSAGVLRCVEDQPPEPQPNQVRVRLQAAGVNPVDALILTGNYRSYIPQLPYTPGLDGAGEVDAVGANVSDLRTGDRVYVAALGVASTGTYAQYVVCDASAVHPLPSSVGFAQGAALGIPYTTAYRAVFQRGSAQPGEAVLVHGASGGVGLAAVQLSVASGLNVIGTAGSEKGRELVRMQGAHHVLDHTAAGYLDAAMEITEGQGAHLIIEMVAHQNLALDFTVLARFGRVVVVGSRGSCNFDSRLVMVAEADIRGTALWNMTSLELAEAHQVVGRHLDAGTAVPVVGGAYPLTEASTAHRRLGEGHAMGKIVLDCS